MGLLAFRSRLSKLQAGTLALTAISEFFLFLATLTPSWQVAEDTDVGRSIQSGLWIYCPGSSQCWYIFSDDLINYYERVDVCRFLLIGDCRKKLLRTPYFFGWHYAVLILMLIVLALGTGAMVVLALGMFRPRLLRITTVLLDVLLAIAFLLGGIGLAVFLINAEMLESRYLIGVKNTFEKTYGYSFYLACLAVSILLFALMAAIFLTSSVFFMRDADAGSPTADDYGEYDGDEGMGQMPPAGLGIYGMPTGNGGGGGGPAQTVGQYNKMVVKVPTAYQPQQYSVSSQQASPMPMKFDDFGQQHVPRYCYAPSDVTSIP